MARQEVGAGPAVHNDLGVAYMEVGNPAQLQKAGAEFRTAVQMDTSFLTAVFNLALFYERTNAPAQAEAQWKRYLELDSNSDWANEARERLQGISR
jgi:Tfp pilus assembly protein PilF